MNEEIDNFIVSLGCPGRYQVLVIFMLTCNIFPVAFNMLNIIFFGVTPPHHCKLPADKSWNANESIMNVKSDNEIDGCHLYRNTSDGTIETISCPDGWDYTLNNNERTLVTEWDLVCDQEYLVGLCATLYFAGMMLGGLVAGTLADKFGRRSVILCCLYIHIIIVVASTQIGNILVYLSLRFILGFCMQGLYGSSITLNMEMVPPNYRATVGCLMDSVWSISISVIALADYIVRDWRYVQIILICPSAITIIYFWLLPESIRWLISKQKVEEIYRIADKYLRFNNAPPRPLLMKEIEELVHMVTKNNSQRATRKYGFRDLFYNGKMALITCTNFFWWFSIHVTFQGLSFSIPKFGGNFYISFFINSAVELATVVILLFLMTKFGRKNLMIILYFLTALCSLSILIMELQELPMEILRIILVLNKILANAVFNILVTYSNELYPTVLRSTGIGLNGVFSMAGAMLAPPLALLADKIWRPFAFLVFTILCTVSGFLSFLMPETLGKAMPEKLEDVNRLWDTGKEVRTNKDISDSYEIEGVIFEGVYRRLSPDTHFPSLPGC